MIEAAIFFACHEIAACLILAASSAAVQERNLRSATEMDKKKGQK